MGMRSAVPIPMSAMRIRTATTVYGRFSAISTTDMLQIPQEPGLFR